MKQSLNKAFKPLAFSLVALVALLFSNVTYGQTMVAAVTADSLCVGDTVKLYASSTRIGGVTFSWSDTSGASTISPNTGDTVSVYPSVSTNYRVVGDSAGVKDTTYFLVKVNALPVVVGSASKNLVCPGDSVTLTGAGALSYSWDNGVTDGVKKAVLVSTTFNVTGTDSKGCKATDTAVVNVRNRPTVKISASKTEVCTNDTVWLTGSGAKTYAWSTSQSGLNKTGNPVWYTVNVARSYYVRGTDSLGCVGLDTVQVGHKTLPRESWNTWNGPFKAENRACMNEPIEMKADLGTNTYTWSPANVVSSTSGAVVSATLGANTNITCKVDSSNGCSRVVSKLIFPLSSSIGLSVNFVGTNKMCAGGTKEISASGGAKYFWSPATGLDNVNSSTVFATLNTSQTYKVQVYKDGCVRDSSVSVLVDPIPDITLSRTDGGKVLCRNESTEVTITSSTGVRFHWGFGVYSTAKVKSVAPGKTTTLKVTAYTAGGCANTAQMLIQVDSTCGDALGARDLASKELMSIKAGKEKSLNLEFSGMSGKKVALNVFDITGKSVASKSVEISSELELVEVSLLNSVEGIHIVQLLSGGESVTKKIFIH